MAFDPAQVRVGGVVRPGGKGGAGKDHRFVAVEVAGQVVVGFDFAEYIQFADPPCDQLGVLGTEIQDENVILHGQK